MPVRGSHNGATTPGRMRSARASVAHSNLELSKPKPAVSASIRAFSHRATTPLTRPPGCALKSMSSSPRGTCRSPTRLSNRRAKQRKKWAT
eukprot:7622567-Pyramimonas_sp.AAC.1